MARFTMRGEDPRRARLPLIAASALLAAALIFGAVRMRQIDELLARAPHLKIGLVQPNFAYTIDGEFSRDEAVRQLAALQEQSAAARTRRSRAGGVERGQLPGRAAARFQCGLRARFDGHDSPRHRHARSSSAPIRTTRRTRMPSTRRSCSTPKAGSRGATTRYGFWRSANTCPASNTSRGSRI